MSERRVGRYLIQERIGAGGMAAVHVGRTLGPAGFSRVVAIKRVHEHLSSEPEFASMLLDEARLTACVRHPNVVATFDVVADGADLFLVMEYVFGDSLLNPISCARGRAEPVPLPVASAIMSGVLSGLHAAHEACNDRGEALDIVHRDVSPHNVLVGADGVARVADFGVAKAVARLHSTQDGKVKGKLAYMAPEQLQSQAVDRRTDIYAAGVVLWELVTSKRLFVGSVPGAVVNAVLAGAHALPSEWRSEVPAALDAVFRRAVALEPADRYATSLDFVVALEAAVPPAPARDVAAWVSTMAQSRLEELRRITHDMPTASCGVVVNAPAPPVDAPPERRGRGSRFRIAALSGLLVTGAAYESVRQWLHASDSPATPTSEAPSGATIAPPVMTEAATVAASPAPDTAPSAPGSHQEPKPGTSPATTRKRGASARGAPPAGAAPTSSEGIRPSPASPSAARCDPPFTIDDKGVKRFKPSCF